jgi:NADH-quinone oxidoreductase subunit J
MVLFLFVIMLVQTRAEEREQVRLYTGQMWPAVIVAFMLAISFFFAMQPAQLAFRPSEGAAIAKEDSGVRVESGPGTISEDTQRVGLALYREAALPFEIASILLLVAIVGAVLLARGTKQEKLYD